ncbi:hypothetical protein SAMN05192574_105249 [Mucilaginibacter gossypiicola]|uniref:NACHT domain-containing protein n=1 Tax=Mucilaginibacter gossypiicola TaxID=551995 RepID=A0A1H8LU52_9SPHI|nr:hypothetical protein [Mucilaginibacter gossypiicola]SEO08593.1 hypothetical protein SAMN05192574_105249 [Mucilaginibacter gossypiicola]
MQENIIEVRVFISCPGDVTEEKDMVRAIIDSINNTLFITNSSIRFKALDWRDIVAKMDGRAQEQINEVFSDYDIYLGMLWMRFGTPTGAINPDTNTEYQSGTEEEFRLALLKYRNGQQINMYLFFKEPKASGTLSETKQHMRVLEFYEEVKSLGWILRIPNKQQSIDFNNKVHSILYEWVRRMETQKLVKEKELFLEQPKADEISFISLNPTTFIAKAYMADPVIQRSLVAFEDQKNKLDIFFEQGPEIALNSLITGQKRIVLLGNAGSGKSIELGQLAHFYARKDTPFIPVYQKMNTYVEDPIEDFLPSGWDSIPERNALIILDGLDEVQPQHFNTAVRQVLNFSDKYPELRMVISCRTNFYHFPENGSRGTLPEFSIYFFSDIPGNKLYGYADRYYNVDVMAFVKAAREEGFTELSKQPFFLNLLLKQFQTHQNLRVDRVEIMDMFIQERINLDQAHFEFTTNLKAQKQRIQNILKRLALSMEAMGRNYVTYDELQIIIPEPGDFELLKYATAFQSSGTGIWGFDHNNIQEYLAASALMTLPLEKIQAFLSFNNKRIKPSWVNTLFFLMSIINDKQRKALVNWIFEIEPEVLVKIEADKVDETTRFELFKRIFAYYKEQKVWLRSNKFTEKELAIFTPQDSGAEYLLNELNDSENLRITRLNALHVIRYLKLNGTILNETVGGIKNFIVEFSADGYAVFDAVHTLEGLGLANRETIDYLMELFGNVGNQYIRAALYSIIINAALINDYIDYFLAGLLSDFDKTEREKVHLMDEGVLLREGLGLVTGYQALKKILQVFKDPFNRKIIDLFERREVFEKILDNVRVIAKTQPTIIDDVYEVYLVYGRVSEEAMAMKIAAFFNQVNAGDMIFKKLFEDNKIDPFEKGLLMQPLLTPEMTDYLISQYEARNTTNKDLLELYDNITRTRIRDSYESEINYLTEQLTNKTQALATVPKINYIELRRQREQDSFNLFFSEEAYRAALRQFFDDYGQAEVNWDDVWKINYYGLNEKYILPDAIFDLLSDFTRRNETITLERAIRFTNREPDFERYRFSKIKSKIEMNSALVISSEQQTQIEEWVKNTILNTDISGAIKVAAENPNYFTYSGTATILWFYIKKYRIITDEQKVLDFTLFDEQKNNEERSLDFEAIEHLVGTQKLQQRILQNLYKGIEFDRAWRNNALYALDNKLVDAWLQILKDLSQSNKSSYVRTSVLNAFAESPGSEKSLMTLLKVIGSDDLQWKIVEHIKDRPAIHDELINYLKNILVKEDYPFDQKFRAARYLTEKGMPEGTRYYVDFLLYEAGPDFDFYHEAVQLRWIRDINFLPELIALLKKAKTDEYFMDDFNRFDSMVSDAIFNIGLISEPNLSRVKKELLHFINENTGKIEHINFLNPMIDRMEYSFYLSQTQNRSVYDAVKEVNDVLILD